MACAYAPAGRLRIKWPNDLLLRGAGTADAWGKLAGILLERMEDAVVIGFGVNLAHAPMLVDRAAASLAENACGAPDVATFVDVLAAAVARWLARWRGEGLDVVRTRWLERAHPVGTPLLARTADCANVEGLFAGLDQAGSLLLHTQERVRTIAAGDVFLL